MNQQPMAGGQDDRDYLDKGTHPVVLHHTHNTSSFPFLPLRPFHLHSS